MTNKYQLRSTRRRIFRMSEEPSPPGRPGACGSGLLRGMAMYRVTLNMSRNYKKTPYNHNLSPGGFAPLKKLPAFAQMFSQTAVPAPHPVLAQGPVIFAGLLKQATQTAIADAACLHIHQHLWKILYTKVLNRQGPQHPVVIGSDAKGGIKIPDLLQEVPREINAWMRRHPTVAQTFGLKNSAFP